MASVVAGGEPASAIVSGIAAIQRKVTNGYRAMWAAEGEADIRSVVSTARLKPGTSVFSIILQTVAA